jgi:hypothetical protein
VLTWYFALSSVIAGQSHKVGATDLNLDLNFAFWVIALVDSDFIFLDCLRALFARGTEVSSSSVFNFFGCVGLRPGGPFDFRFERRGSETGTLLEAWMFVVTDSNFDSGCSSTDSDSSPRTNIAEFDPLPCADEGFMELFVLIDCPCSSSPSADNGESVS